jgi:ABC-type lipoprotein release transport system permease subunit
MYNIKENLIEGTIPTEDYEVLIGKDLQTETGIKIGDEVEVLTNLGVAEKFIVTGFFDLGV